jgi:hypothetical protein
MYDKSLRLISNPSSSVTSWYQSNHFSAGASLGGGVGALGPNGVPPRGETGGAGGGDVG